jgi:hypothetical protein
MVCIAYIYSKAAMVQVTIPFLSQKMRLLRSLPHLSALPLEPPHSLLLPLHIN